MTMTNEQEMYGCSKAELDEMIADSIMPLMGEHYMLAMSILSDSQECIAIGMHNRARQYINRAKYVLTHWKDSTENVG
jgi:hypothetical protein